MRILGLAKSSVPSASFIYFTLFYFWVGWVWVGAGGVLYRKGGMDKYMSAKVNAWTGLDWFGLVGDDNAE